MIVGLVLEDDRMLEKGGYSTTSALRIFNKHWGQVLPRLKSDLSDCRQLRMVSEDQESRQLIVTDDMLNISSTERMMFRDVWERLFDVRHTENAVYDLLSDTSMAAKHKRRGLENKIDRKLSALQKHPDTREALGKQKAQQLSAACEFRWRERERDRALTVER